jgi:hypothetical protein
LEETAASILRISPAEKNGADIETGCTGTMAMKDPVGTCGPDKLFSVGRMWRGKKCRRQKSGYNRENKIKINKK